MSRFQVYVFKVFLLLFFTQLAWAQTTLFELSVNPSNNPIEFPADGGSAILTYTVLNAPGGLDENSATIVNFTYDFQLDPVNVTSSNQSWNCFQSTGQISCEHLDPYPSGFSSDLVMTLTAPQSPTNIANAVSADLTNAAAGNGVINSDINFVALGTDVDLQTIKTITAGFPSTVAPGDPISFDIAVTNLSANQAFNIDLTDDLLVNGLEFDQVNSSMECFDDSTEVHCNVSALLGGATQNFRIAATVSQSAVLGNFINSATVTSNEIDTDLSNNKGDQPFTIALPGTPEVEVSKVVVSGATQITQGTVVEYLIEADNTGTADALNVDLTDVLPPGVTYQSHVEQGVNFNCTYTAPTLNCLAPVLPNSIDHDGVLITAIVDGAVNTVISNTVTTTFVDSEPDDNADTVAFNVIAPVVDLGLNMTSDQSSYDVGDFITLDLTLNNALSSSAPALNTVVTTTLPSETTFSSAQVSNAAGWSCTHDGANTGGNVVCDSLGNPVAIGDEVTIEIIAVADSVTSNLTTTNASVASDFDNNPSNDSADTMFEIVAGNSDFTFTLTSMPQQVSQGEDFTHRLTIRNSGNSNLNDVSAVYVVPQAAELVSFLADGFSCNRSSNTFSCTNNQVLTVGSTQYIDFNLVVDNYVGMINRSASVTADGAVKSASTNTQITSNAQHDLSLIKTASVTEIGRNEPFTYVLDVLNLGSETQTNFNLVDQLPAGVVLQSTSGTNWNCTGASQLNCQFVGNLVAGGQSQLIINVLASDELGSINNTASVNLDGDENPANNTSSASVDVIDGTGGGSARADLSVMVEVDNNDVINTETISWRIKVNNSGPDDAENLVVSSSLPIGFVAENVQVMGGAECILLTASLVCEIATLESGQSNEVVLTGGFTAGFSGLLINTVEVVSDTVDGNPANNLTNSEVNVTAVDDLSADLSLQLNASSQQVQQGGVVELSFIANNLGPDAAVNAQINGSVSGLVENIQIINSGLWMCQVNNQALSCNHPGDLQVGMQSEISIRVQTQQVVQQSQPVVFNASITTDSMDDQPANNMIAFTNEVNRTPTEDEIFAIFQNSVGDGASETVIQTIRNVSSYCARSYFTAIEGLCEEFIEDATPENGGAIINAMEEITPNEVVAQSNSAAEIITSQFRNVSSRLAQLRGGGGAGFSVSGLTGRYGNESIPIGMLSYLNQGEGEEAVSNINDFVSPWGFFVNGSISMGERDATGRELGFDFDTYGVTAGVDYRFSPTRVAGLALGYANFDSDIEGEAEMQSTSLTLTGYGSFYIKDNFYVDARISYGNPDFEQKRRINFVVDDIAIDRVATGNTDSNQYSVAMSAGYHFNKNAWNITPNASIRYVRTTIDAFQETGAGGFNFAFGEQEVKSMVWSVGASISRAISLKNGVISPQFDFNLSRETENDGGLLEARFINAPDDEIFWIGTDEPDRTYGDAGIGLVFIGANGKQAYINYRNIFGLEGFTRGTINVGARFEF